MKSIIMNQVVGNQVVTKKTTLQDKLATGFMLFSIVPLFTYLTLNYESTQLFVSVALSSITVWAMFSMAMVSNVFFENKKIKE